MLALLGALRACLLDSRLLHALALDKPTLQDSWGSSLTELGATSSLLEVIFWSGECDSAEIELSADRCKGSLCKGGGDKDEVSPDTAELSDIFEEQEAAVASAVISYAQRPR